MGRQEALQGVPVRLAHARGRAEAQPWALGRCEGWESRLWANAPGLEDLAPHACRALIAAVDEVLIAEAGIGQPWAQRSPSYPMEGGNWVGRRRRPG